MKILRMITIFLFVLSLALYLGISFRYKVVLDRVPPKIQSESEVLEVSVNATGAELLAGVTARDNRDGDLTEQVMIQGISRLLTEDTARITYVVADSSDNIASCTRTLRYTDYENPRLSIGEMTVYRTFPHDDTIDRLCKSLTARDVRDGDLSDQIVVAVHGSNDRIEGELQLTVQVTNSMGGTEVIPLTIVIDNEGAVNPLVTLREYITYVDKDADFIPSDYILTVNGEDFEGDYPALHIHSNVDTAVPGAYQVCYQYKDFTVYQTVVVR